jgi:hypothetical protein
VIRPELAEGRWISAVRMLAALSCVLACSGESNSPADGAAEGSGGAGGLPTTTGGVPATGGGDGDTGGAGGAAAGATPSGGSAGPNAGGTPTGNWLVPARIRRLANAEYDGSVQALLSTEQSPATGPDFPPDLRQDGFTVSDTQRVDAVLVERLDEAALGLVAEAREAGTLARLAPCASNDEPKSCARAYITSFGGRVYRRPLLDEEVQALLALYEIGAETASYEDGIAHVTRGLLQSAGFLYLTELGDGGPARNHAVQLTPHEIAVQLSYSFTSAPPDDELAQKAAAGALADPEQRAAQVRRLFETDARARDTAVRLVREWLGIDRIDDSAKDSLVYPEFEKEKPKIVAESRDFVGGVAFESTGNISELFNADWTVDSGPLSLYQVAAKGPIPASSRLTGRIGILNQAAFLATYANAHESHPVFRGVAIAQRVTCLNLDSPASFNIQVVPPLPDPTKTTRELFSAHPEDELCASCHDIIDPFGFSFEHFDGMGAYRDSDNGKPVDSAVTVSVDQDYDGDFADSNEFALALAKSERVRECFARFMFRAVKATGDNAATPGETEFMDFWRKQPKAGQGDMLETWISIAKSPTFALREEP